MFSLNKLFTLYAIFRRIHKFQVLSTKGAHQRRRKITVKSDEKMSTNRISFAEIAIHSILFYTHYVAI